ncbi:MAG: hypothetical protein JSR66_15740 [Proteobacteria bacterium]|nr:hypothetical protein [Pseudomonadota bacterium]
MRRLVPWAACALMMTGCASLGGSGDRSAPTQLRVDCANAVVVSLRWEPPLGASWWRRSSQYAVTRNGVPMGATLANNFVDTTVAASKSYSYSVNGGAALVVNTPAAAPAGDPPYCQSPHLQSMSFDWAGGYTEPNGSDLWPVTWAKDGGVYAFFGDGGGFGGDNHRGRVSFGVAKLLSPPPFTPQSGKNIYGGYESEYPSILDGKAGSIIAVDNDFYTIGGLWNARELQGVKGHKSGAPRRNQLGYSKGNAHSWQASQWSFCTPDSPPGGFCAGGFINFGRGNHGAPDGYVYLLGVANSRDYWAGDDGPEVAAEQGSTTAPPDAAPATSFANTYLARVSKRHVLEHDAYEYFAGLDAKGRPAWTREQQHMQPVFTDRAGTSLESAYYIPGIRRYIAVAQGSWIGQTSFYDAPQPWGPWTTVSYNNIDPQTGNGGWANLGKAGGGTLGVHVVNAWTSKDGLSLWMTYSSDGKAPAGALFPPPGTMLDSFNLVHAQLMPRSSASH